MYSDQPQQQVKIINQVVKYQLFRYWLHYYIQRQINLQFHYWKYAKSTTSIVTTSFMPQQQLIDEIARLILITIIVIIIIIISVHHLTITGLMISFIVKLFYLIHIGRSLCNLRYYGLILILRSKLYNIINV